MICTLMQVRGFLDTLYSLHAKSNTVRHPASAQSWQHCYHCLPSRSSVSTGTVDLSPPRISSYTLYGLRIRTTSQKPSSGHRSQPTKRRSSLLSLRRSGSRATNSSRRRMPRSSPSTSLSSVSFTSHVAPQTQEPGGTQTRPRRNHVTGEKVLLST